MLSMKRVARASLRCCEAFNAIAGSTVSCAGGWPDEEASPSVAAGRITAGWPLGVSSFSVGGSGGSGVVPHFGVGAACLGGVVLTAPPVVFAHLSPDGGGGGDGGRGDFGIIGAGASVSG